MNWWRLFKCVQQEVDTRRKGEIGFEAFATLYHTLIFDDTVSIL